MSNQLYHVAGDFDFEGLVWTDKGWRDPFALEGARVILFDNTAEALQCSAAVRSIAGGHEANQRMPIEVSPTAELPGEPGWEGWVMYGDVEQTWPDL